MSQEKAKTIQYFYGLAFLLLSVALAFLLILQVCDIYFNGGVSPYTVESIKEHFDKIAIIVYLWIGMAIVGLIIWQMFPEQKKLNGNDVYYTFNCLKKKLFSRNISDNERYKQFKRTQTILNTVKFACGLCVCLSVVFSLAYLCDRSNFKDQNDYQEIVKAVFYLLPFVVVAFAICISTAVFEKIVIKKQMPEVKQLLKDNSNAEVIIQSSQRLKLKITGFFERESTITAIRLFVAIIAVTLLVYGLATGGSAGVLAKAINICQQCIGLG